jgi:hypothetical protein
MATVALALLLLIMMAIAISGASTLSIGVARDADMETLRVQALLMAETGIERASYRFNNGIGCNNLAESSMSMTNTSGTSLGTIVLTTYSTAFDGTTALAKTACRVRAVATTASGQVTRTIESIINPSASSTRGNKVFLCTGNTGADGVVVGVSWTTALATDTSITGISFNGYSMTKVSDAIVNVDSSSRYKTQNWYLTSNVSPGTDLTGIMSFNGATPSQIVFGCTFLSGTSSSSPIDTASVVTDINSGTYINKSVTASGTSGTRVVVDSLVRNNGASWSVVTATGRTQEWSNGSSGAGGAGSNYATIAANGTASMCWYQSGNAGCTGGTGSSKAYAWQGFAMFATGYVNEDDGRAKSAGTFSTGVTGWREITVPPS